MIFLTDENRAIVRFINDKLDNSAVIDKVKNNSVVSEKKEEFIVKEISEKAFISEESLQNLLLPNVVTIKESAFEDCKNLVVLIAGREEAKNSNLIIQHNAFKDCYELRDIVLLGYDKITIESGAFSGCNKLRSLVIDNAELDIRSDSFSDADNFKFCVFSRNEKNNALLEKYGLKTAKYVELK